MRPVRISAVITILVTALVFAPSLAGELIWDDHDLVEHGARSFVDAVTRRYLETSDVGGYYRPIAKLTLFLTQQLAGTEAFGFHLVTLALHLGVVGLAFTWITARLRRDGKTHEDGRFAAAVALSIGFFAVHPARVESVAWISGLTDPLLAVASLIALWAWELRRDARTALAVFVLTFVAMGAKETASVLPLALASDAVLRERDPRVRRQSFAVAGASALAVAAFWAVRIALVPLPSNVRAPFGPDSATRVASTIGHYLAHYTMASPSSMLAASRSVDASGHEVFTRASVAVGALAVVAVLAWAYRASRDPEQRPWFADFLLAVWFLSPVLNVIPLNLKPLVAERFLYVPAIALACLATRILLAALDRARPIPVAALAAASLIVGVGVVRTLERIPDFRSEEALFTREHQLAPLTALPIELLAEFATRRGDTERAITLYLEGYAAGVALHDEAEAVDALASALRLRSQGTSDASIEDLRQQRAFYDALGVGRRATIALPDLRARLRLSRTTRARLFVRPAEFVVPWAEIRARTGDIDGGLAVLRAHAGGQPTAEVVRERMWLNARLGRLAEVERDVRWLDVHGDESPENRVAARTALAATRVLSRPRQETGATMSFIIEANALLALRAPGLARTRLAAMRSATPGARELVLLEARIDAVDGRPDLGRRAIENARAAAPDGGWDQVLEAFDRDTARVVRRR